MTHGKQLVLHRRLVSTVFLSPCSVLGLAELLGYVVGLSLLCWAGLDLLTHRLF